MKKTMFWLAAAPLTLGLLAGGCSLFDWLSGDDDDETEEPAGIVYSFDPKVEGMEPWQVVISPDAAYFRLPGIERPGYRLYWRNLETGLYILPGKRLLFSSPLWTRNCRFEAEWERLIYIIAYHEGGGQSAPGNPFRYTVESEDIYLFPLTKAGWMFGGWYDNVACTGEPVTVIPRGSTGYKEFWAKWVANFINLTTPSASTGEGGGWTYDSAGGVFTISDAEVRVTGTTTRDRIVVSGTATITLDGASITLSGTTAASPLDLANGANLTLKLSGTSTLTAAGGGAGIYAPEGTTLTITSAAGDGQTSGTLNATGSGSLANNKAGAGIGGGASGGTITIAGGTITAIGGTYVNSSDNTWCGGGAGIGGGLFGAGGTITISAGTVTATGGYTGAGIGSGGWGGEGGTITISGGTVTATGSGDGGAGIGGGYDAAGGVITISGGVVSAVSLDGNGDAAGIGGAGIGGGYYGSGGNITISSGTVTVTGGYGSAGIGGGYYGSGGNITISGGVVSAVSLGGLGDAAGIGGGGGGASGDISITGGHGTAQSYTGRAAGPGTGGSFGSFTGPGNKDEHGWPTANPYTW